MARRSDAEGAQITGRRSVIGQYRTDITCRSCNATPRERGDQVSERAAEYTCSRCLMGLEGPGAKNAPGAPERAPEGRDSGSPKSASKSLENSGTSAAGFSLQRKLGGRPRQYASATERKREEMRRYRKRRQRAGKEAG